MCNPTYNIHQWNVVVVEVRKNIKSSTPPNIGRMQRYVCKVCSHEWVSTRRMIFDDEGNGTMISSTPNRCPSCRSTLWNNDNLYKHKCQRCDHKWVSKTKSPYKCPDCLSARWNAPTEICKCKMCGYTWEKKKKSDPLRCPSCNSCYWNKDSKIHKCISCGTEYAAKVNRCNRCPKCNKKFYTCICHECGHAWNDDSGNRPTKCTKCDSPKWQNKNHNKSKRELVLEWATDTIDIDSILKKIDMGPDYAQVIQLLTKGEKPLEIAMITDKSFNSVIQARNGLVTLITDEGELVS